MPAVDDGLERLGCREVYLVYDHDGGDAAVDDALDDLIRAVALLDGIGYVEYDIGIVYGAADEVHHRLLEFVCRFEYSGRVGIYDLEILAVDYAHYTVARGLRLRGYDREALAHKRIHERRLADIGVADDIYES